MFIIFLRLITDSIRLAFSSLIANKLRTFLSLLGVSIGIFCIISVMTVIDSLEREIRNNVASLGSNVVYIQKWPWTYSSNYPWWRYVNRPVVNFREYEELKRRVRNAEYVVFRAETTGTVEHKSNSVQFIGITIATHDFYKLRGLEIEQGRYFTNLESETGQNVIVLGNTVARMLFGDQNPINETVSIAGNRLNVVGVIKKEGEGIFGNSIDYEVIIPFQYGRNRYNVNSESLNPNIMVSAKDNISNEQLIDELSMIMRTIRRLKPIEEDNFALNQASMISSSLDSIFRIIDLAGFIIGGFAILVGGFGIANIMFVSVKERTKIIGIQKAIGAKSYLILLQFLTEAVTLCLMGGISGLFTIWLSTVIILAISPLGLILSMNNIIYGIGISIAIGIISGFAPANQAAKLNPVDAINHV